MRQGVYSAPKYLHHYPPQNAKKWAQDIQCIIKSSDPDRGSLYLSNVQAAENPATVKKLRVGAILSCAKGYIISHPTNLVPLYKYIPGQDKQTFDISLHFDQAVEFIHQALERTNIIVHCIAGVSRSASMVIAYFMRHRKLNFHQAFSEVKSKRKIISPNDGFIKHLKKYEQKLRFALSQIGQRSVGDKQQDFDLYHRTFSGQFYSPTKKYDYGRNFDLTRSTAKNPESGFKEDIYRTQIKTSTFLKSPPKQNDNIKGYKSYSMTLIPGDMPISPRMNGRYGMTMSKQLSPRKSMNFTSEKPRPLTRDVIHQDKRAANGYFDSMNTQLNAKIEAIRQKYEQQRKQLIKTHSAKIPEKEKSVYVQRKAAYNMNGSFTEKKDYYKHDKRDVLFMYDRNMNLKLNQRMSHIDQLYAPRVSAGYGLGLGYYGKRYH